MGILKDIIKAHADRKNDFISEWYWRKKYNTLVMELEQIKEVMASDIYEKVIKDMTQPMEIKRYKKTIERLNNKVIFLQEERNRLYDENKLLKKKGGRNKNGEEETGFIE